MKEWPQNRFQRTKQVGFVHVGFLIQLTLTPDKQKWIKHCTSDLENASLNQILTKIVGNGRWQHWCICQHGRLLSATPCQHHWQLFSLVEPLLYIPVGRLNKSSNAEHCSTHITRKEAFLCVPLPGKTKQNKPAPAEICPVYGISIKNHEGLKINLYQLALKGKVGKFW